MTEKQSNQEKGTTPKAPGKREVDLFPVAHERRVVAAAQPSTSAPARGGIRLGTQISVFNPVTFDDALEIVETLRSRAATTIALDQMKKPDASRLIDFVTGASAALDGDFHKLTEQVYVFCPSNISIIQPEKPAAKQNNGALDFLFSTDALTGEKFLGLKS